MRTDVGHREGNYVILRMLSVRSPPSVLAKHRADADEHGYWMKPTHNLSHVVVLFGRSIGLDKTVAEIRES